MSDTQTHTSSPTSGRKRWMWVLLTVVASLLFVGLCVVICLPAPEPVLPPAPERDEEPTALLEETAVDETIDDTPQPQPAVTAPAPEAATQAAAVKKGGILDLFSSLTVLDLENEDSVSPHLARLEKMPEPTQRMKVNYFGNLRQVFNDSNHVHHASAVKHGIEPLTDTRSHWQNTRDIVKVTTCADFYIDDLRHSSPYLVPQAAATLHEIGRRFRDTIQARGGGDYRIKVTSLLRTPSTIKRLRRSNRNAIDASVHQLGTTFDISYASFVASSPEPARSVDDLKGVLAEVLRAMRSEGKLWVKYEVGQPCFHITARKPES